MNLGNPYNIYYVDWLDEFSTTQFEKLKQKARVRRVEMQETIADVYRLCADMSTTEYFMLLSGATDYTGFDFNYQMPEWETQYLHVLGASTWVGNKSHAKKCAPDLKYIEAFPDLHFVDLGLKVRSQLLDIVYISNGEPLAEQHYQHLVDTVKTGNKIHRVNGVNGRTQAYQSAARLSNTPWFFAVFAKLEVDPNFDWTWLPTADTGPEHYVFNAVNPVNELVYGHMAMIAYNKLLTLNTNEPGLDFTLSKPNRPVPLLSGIARYDQNPTVTWRTAFREVLKLRSYLKNQDDQEAISKITNWETIGHGPNGVWSIRGANDANDYFDSCQGNYDRIKLSYEWAWLDQYFKSKYF